MSSSSLSSSSSSSASSSSPSSSFPLSLATIAGNRVVSSLSLSSLLAARNLAIETYSMPSSMIPPYSTVTRDQLYVIPITDGAPIPVGGPGQVPLSYFTTFSKPHSKLSPGTVNLLKSFYARHFSDPHVDAGSRSWLLWACAGEGLTASAIATWLKAERKLFYAAPPQPPTLPPPSSSSATAATTAIKGGGGPPLLKTHATTTASSSQTSSSTYASYLTTPSLYFPDDDGSSLDPAIAATLSLASSAKRKREEAHPPSAAEGGESSKRGKAEEDEESSYVDPRPFVSEWIASLADVFGATTSAVYDPFTGSVRATPGISRAPAWPSLRPSIPPLLAQTAKIATQNERHNLSANACIEHLFERRGVDSSNITLFSLGGVEGSSEPAILRLDSMSRKDVEGWQKKAIAQTAAVTEELLRPGKKFTKIKKEEER